MKRHYVVECGHVKVHGVIWKAAIRTAVDFLRGAVWKPTYATIRREVAFVPSPRVRKRGR